MARILGSAQFDPDSEDFGFPAEVLEWGMARSVRAALFNDDRDFIVTRRRRNYELLLSNAGRFRNSRPVLPQLPTGVCPLYFPLFSEDPARCVRELRRGAVSSIIWWGTSHTAVPWTQFPEASQLKRRIVAIPIHQDLRDDHVLRIAELLS
jgi:dTDP-4-amino-4,6-dideoxygalactose transaminase